MESISEEAGANGIDLRRSRRRKMPAIDPAKLDRLPPHSTEAEQGVLGCCLWSPATALAECSIKIKEGDEVYYDLRHQTIHTTLLKLQNAGKPIELISLQQQLKDDGFLDQVGGIPYLSSLQDAVPSAANLSYYLEVLLEKFTLRMAIRLCTDFVGRAYDNEGEVDTLMDEFERDALRVRPQTIQQRTRPQLIKNALTRIQKRFESKGKPSGILTGLRHLDYVSDGLHPGELIVIAAYPSMGKSALAGNISDAVAVEQGIPVGVFTLEMTSEEWIERMIASRARINLRSHNLTEQDFKNLTITSQNINASPIFIEDDADITIGQLRAKARRLHQLHGIKVWIVDYLQLLSAPDVASKENREREVSSIGEGLKKMAKELEGTVIVLSQLNDDGKLRESRATGQHADGVWKLSREEVLDNGKFERMKLDLEKQRNGARGAVPLGFLPHFTRFESVARGSEEPAPGPSDSSPPDDPGF